MSKLFRDIRLYLDKTSIAESYFGFLAVKNSALVSRIKVGRRVWPETEARIRAFMAENPPESFPRYKRRRRKADLFAGAGTKVREGEK